MAHELSEDQQEVLDELHELKGHARDLEEAFKAHRNELRERAIVAVTHYGLSVKKAAETAGIDRRTLTVWLQVHNADEKRRKK